VLVYGRPVDVEDHLAYTPDVVAFDGSVISLRESAPFRRYGYNRAGPGFFMRVVPQDISFFLMIVVVLAIINFILLLLFLS
jgi:hypothetical protein